MAQFIINMEEAQKKSVRTQLPITDNMLAAFATYMFLKTNSFPRNRPVWYSNPVGDQKCSAWKKFFKQLQLALESKTIAARDAPDMFGTATTVHRLHGIVPGIPDNGNSGDTPGLLELLDGQFDALTAASSTSNAALDYLFSTTIKQYAEIKAALKNLLATMAAPPSSTAAPSRTAGTRTGSLPSNQLEKEKKIIILQVAVKNK